MGIRIKLQNHGIISAVMIHAQSDLKDPLWHVYWKSADRLTCDCSDIELDFILEYDDDIYKSWFTSTRDIACPNLARLFAHRSNNRNTRYMDIHEHVVYILINYQGFLIFCKSKFITYLECIYRNM